jgi:Fe-S cluster assembly ATP-binding protein
MLKIKNLSAKADGKVVLHDINLSINAGETHAIMGPNGSGKTTLANILAGKENYQVIKGSVEFEKENLLPMSVEKRASHGVFLALQYPIEIEGINNLFFLKTALNSIRKSRGLPELDTFDFMSLVKEKMSLVKLPESFLQRPLNVGFSGGEKKRNEILQMLILEPKLAILDETDSGLDIDALKVVSKGINSFRSPSRAILMVTHYQRLLNYVKPDFVHVLMKGKIVKSGTAILAKKLEEKGYAWLEK